MGGAIHSDIRPCTKIPSTKIVSIDHHHTLPHSTLSHRHTSSILGTPLSADRHCLASPITPSRHQIYAQKSSSCARRPPVIHATRPPGGAVVNTLPASWKPFLQSNGAPAHHESNNKDTNTRRWAVFHRRDYPHG